MGVRVVLVEPSQTDTDLWRLADREFDESVAQLEADGRYLYNKHLAAFARRSHAPSGPRSRCTR